MRLTFLQMCITGSIFVLAVLLFRLMGRKGMPNVLFYWLWNVAALLFLIPFRVPASFNVYSIIKGLIGISGGSQENLVAVDLFKSTGGQPWLGTQHITGSSPVESGVIAVLLAGAALALVVWAVQSCYWAVKIRSAEQVDECGWISRWVDERWTPHITLKKLDGINSPFIFGYFRLQVLFPMDWNFENRHETELVLEHELAHAMHFDNFRKSIFTLLLCIHWYNPVVWAMYKLAAQDMELFSDERVVRHWEFDVRENYAQMLLTVSSKGVGRTLMAHNCLAERVMRERIIAIMKTKKITWVQRTLSFSCLCAIALFFATGCASAYKSKDVMPQDVGTVSLYDSSGGSIPEVLVTNYTGDSAKLKNGDVLILADNATPETLQEGTRVSAQFNLTPVEGFDAGQTIGFGYINGDDWHEEEVVKVQDGTALEYTIPKTGSYSFYLQSYCTDTIYFSDITLDTD